MKALLFERNLPRLAAARMASTLAPGSTVGLGPLRLVDMEPPALPGPGWHRVRPVLAGICGSDLTTIDGRSSRWFEPMVSFPFVPGHEVVGLLQAADDSPGPSSAGSVGHHAEHARVVLEPVLGCTTRAIEPPCPACAAGHVGGCQRVAFGHLRPGLQTGYCTDTGGGWSAELVAHESQLHAVPRHLDDQAAVMVEPTACAVHAVLAAQVAEGERVVVLGAGTLGLCALAALRHLALPATVVAGAKHPEQRRLAAELGADVVVEPDEVRRAVRRLTRSLAVGPGTGSQTGREEGAGSAGRSSGGRLTGGADVVMDCVGSAQSLEEALAVVRPRGRIVLVGMPGHLSVDLTPLWQREVRLMGAYAYGREDRPDGPVRTFDLAFEVVEAAGLGRLVSARYPLERYEEAIAHAAGAGRRGGVKIVFDISQSQERTRR